MGDKKIGPQEKNTIIVTSRHGKKRTVSQQTYIYRIRWRGGAEARYVKPTSYTVSQPNGESVDHFEGSRVGHIPGSMPHVYSYIMPTSLIRVIVVCLVGEK